MANNATINKTLTPAQTSRAERREAGEAGVDFGEANKWENRFFMGVSFRVG
jgi:hypothetical protein